MSGIIHGASHKAIKGFREEPAAMSVYWIYVSRTNKDNVAWPSGSGLARDTGWCKEKCLDARQWLVEHNALERADGYVRPEWMNLDEDTRRKKMNLDRCEYYRPTGVINIDGKDL